MFRRTTLLCLLFASCVMPHFCGLRTPPGGYDPQIRTRLRFLCSAATPKFHHPVFTRSEVTMLTNKPTNRQTLLKTSSALCYAMTWDNHANKFVYNYTHNYNAHGHCTYLFSEDTESGQTQANKLTEHKGSISRKSVTKQ